MTEALIETPNAHQIQRPVWPDLVIAAIGVLLIVTALLKAISPSQAVSVGLAYGLSYATIAIVVQVELLFAALLLSGWQPRLSRGITLALFCVFAGFSLLLAISGQESCGCFGALKVSPWITFSLDILVAGFLGTTLNRPTSPHLASPWRVRFAALSYVLFGISSLTYMIVNRPVSIASDLLIDSSTGLVILEPEEWIGKAFPIEEYLRPRIDFENGNAIVLLYHHDCPECQKALPLYDKLAAGIAKGGQKRLVVVVEIPPYGSHPHQGTATSVRLFDETEWFVQAPVEIQLKDGVVASYSRDLPSVENLR